MKFGIYESESKADGRIKKIHRVCFGDAPRFLGESKDWKLVYTESRLSPYSPKEACSMFIKQIGLKPNYIDQNSGINQFGVGFPDLESLTIADYLKEFLMTNSEDIGESDTQISYNSSEEEWRFTD